MSTAEQIRDWALQLSPRERAELAHELLLSLDAAASDADVDAEWAEEIEARAEAYRTSELKADDWKASIGRVRDQLKDSGAP